jgi:hypothetical protein
VPASVEALVNACSAFTLFMRFKDYFTPSQLIALLAAISPTKLMLMVCSVLSSTPLLGFTG